MTISETPYTSLSAAAENHQLEPPTSLPQRCADWISYAVAVIQQAAPGPADFAQTEA